MCISFYVQGYNSLQVTDVLRQQAKQICYGVIYGMGTKTLSEQLSIPEEVALEFTESFHNKYPGIKKYIQKVIEKCKQDEFVETIMGRRRYLPNINDKTVAVKSKLKYLV